jgi:hypothetical protein
MYQQALLLPWDSIHGGVVDATSLRCLAPLLTPMLVHPNSWNTRCIAQPRLMTVLGEVANFLAIVARVTGRRRLLGWPDCQLLLLLLCWWSVVVLLLLLLLWAIAPELRWRAAGLSRGWGVDHAYFRGALLEPPPEGPDTTLFLFFSSAASQAFMVPSWSMAALANSLYDRFWERIRRSCN